MNKPLLIAIGGNSLIRAGQSGSVREQIANANTTCRHVAKLVEQGHKIVITRGNGPHVEAQLIRSELAHRPLRGLARVTPNKLRSPILEDAGTMPGCLPESSSACVSLFVADCTS